MLLDTKLQNCNFLCESSTEIESVMNRYIQYMYSYPHKTAYGSLENINLNDYFYHLEGGGHSLYLHLPFCESKCGYCDLFSVTGFNKISIDHYIESVINQIKQYKQYLPQNTVFQDFIIGGGTPLLLTDEQLLRVFEMVKTYMPLSKDCKIIIETAPNQTTKENVALLKKVGVTRVSLGIQSFYDMELRQLQRNHCREQALQAATLLSESHFDCVNFDFIYGIPNQTKEHFLNSLKQAIAFSPNEIYLYPLYIKHGVKLVNASQKNNLDLENTYRLYQYGSAYLKENGYTQRSMRCFLKKTEENQNQCRSSFSECGFKSTLSLGCGGRTYLGRLHTCTPYKITRCAALEEINNYIQIKDHMIVNHGIILSDEELKRRYVIKHILMIPGISKKAYKKAFDSDLLVDFPIINEWIKSGWIDETQDFICLSEVGLGLSDYIGPQLISEEIKAKMLEWERVNG